MKMTLATLSFLLLGSAQSAFADDYCKLEKTVKFDKNSAVCEFIISKGNWGIRGEISFSCDGKAIIEETKCLENSDVEISQLRTKVIAMAGAAGFQLVTPVNNLYDLLFLNSAK